MRPTNRVEPTFGPKKANPEDGVAIEGTPAPQTKAEQQWTQSPISRLSREQNIPIWVVTITAVLSGIIGYNGYLYAEKGDIYYNIYVLNNLTEIYFTALLIFIIFPFVFSYLIIGLFYPFKFFRRSNSRRSLIFWLSVFIIFASLLPTQVSKPSTWENLIEKKSKNYNNTSTSKKFDDAKNKEFKISKNIIELEEKAQYQPVYPLYFKISAYQFLVTSLQNEFERNKISVSGRNNNEKFLAYEKEVLGRIGSWNQTIQIYNSRMLEGFEITLPYLLHKEFQKELINKCSRQGVELGPLFLKVGKIDEVVQHEADRILTNLFGDNVDTFVDDYLARPEVREASKTAVDALIKSIKDIAPANITDGQICKNYYANNIDRPERKSFLNKHADRYQSMKELK